MKRRQFIQAGALSLAAVAGAGALVSCTSSGGGNKSGGPTKITMLVLGDKPTNGRYQAMLEKLNPRLTEQANVTLDFFFVEWADWQTQYNVQLLAGDSSIDLISTATDWLFAWENAKKGAFLPLTEEMLQKNAPKTWAQVNSKGHWDLCKLDGKIYFAPEDNYTQWTNHGFFYRGDWATAAGIPNGTITKDEQLTTYFQWVKSNKAGVYPWDVAATNDSALTSYLQGHTGNQTIQQVSASSYYPFQTTEFDPYSITSWYMEGDDLVQAANQAKKWNDIGVWREDALNYSGDTRSEFFAGKSGADQHHTQTFVGAIWSGMTTKQPGSDPKMYWFGQENHNIFRDIKTHGAMAVSANSKNPEKALQFYDLIRNDKTDYMLLSYGIEGTDYVLTSAGKLDYPAGYDSSKDGLGTDFWAGRMDEFEPVRATDDPDKDAVYSKLDSIAKDYPYSTLFFNKDAIDPTLAAIGGVLAQYVPQLEFGKFGDPAKAITEMRGKLAAAGWADAVKSLQADMDKWAKAKGLK